MSVEFVVRPSWVDVPSAPQEIIKLIQDEASARDPQAFFNGGASHFQLARIADGVFQFPTGLLWKVVQHLDSLGIEYALKSDMGGGSATRGARNPGARYERRQELHRSGAHGFLPASHCRTGGSGRRCAPDVEFVRQVFWRGERCE